MNTIRNLSILLLFGALALPGCGAKSHTKTAKLENKMVEERIIESEENASETPSKEDLSQGL